MYSRILIIVLLFSLSCNKGVEQKLTNTGNTGYNFSIIDYVEDQWSIYKGQAFPIKKKVRLNGNTDSAYTNTLDLDWGSVFKVFFETDIGDEKFHEQYKLSIFRDDQTMTNNFYYEAKDKKLYTRKLHVMADSYTDKIKSIYIEAEKNTRLGTKTIKLFYSPLDIITIQEQESTKTGKEKDLRIEYDFI